MNRYATTVSVACFSSCGTEQAVMIFCFLSYHGMVDDQERVKHLDPLIPGLESKQTWVQVQRTERGLMPTPRSISN
jgi:hypothetical protein